MSTTSHAIFEKAAKAEVGYREGANNATKYGRWFADIWNNSYFAHAPYCAMGLSWLVRNGGKDTTLGYYASTSAWVAKFKSVGRWYSSPKVGDLAFYTYSHVELVTKVTSGYIYTIGFNTSSGVGSQRDGNGVYARVRRRDSTIRGYGRPHYTSSPSTSKPAPPAKSAPVAASVKSWQTLLKFNASGRDGLFGPATDKRSQLMRKASKNKGVTGISRTDVKLIQSIIGTAADGAYGPKSRTAHVAWIKKVQKFFGVSADGDWGPKTDGAFNAFRKKHLL